ncbi:MAG: PDZ domain-containing protein [Steroidobacteraceae bacterium]
MRLCPGVLALLIFGLAARGSVAKDASLLSLGMEHFKDTASVVDDPAKGLTTISTERGFVETSGPMRTVWHDEFLSALIDDKTGRKSFQLDVSVTYSGARKGYPSADLVGMGGPKAAEAALVKTETANCATGECMYTDHVVIPVEEGLLRHLAAGYVPGKPALLTYKLVAKRGVGYQGELSNAEIAGLLAKVDGYAAEPAPAAAAPPTPRRLDFGISGIVVSASADMPNRAGVLVAAVNGASVAGQAGIITGDIIYQIDDRPTRSLADLEAAVAASAAHATATLRIFRGVKELALKARF